METTLLSYVRMWFLQIIIYDRKLHNTLLHSKKLHFTIVYV